MYYPDKIFTSSVLKPFCYPERVGKRAMRLPGGINWLAGQICYETLVTANAVQTITFGGTITGGTFNLVFPTGGGGQYVPVVWNATGAVLAANIQTALNNYFGPGQIIVSGTGPFTLTYLGNLYSAQDVPIPAYINLLTGTNTTIAIAQTTQGSGGMGFYEPWVAGNPNSVTAFSFVMLESNTRTDAAGNVLDEHGGTGEQTVDGIVSGAFLASVPPGFANSGATILTGLDTTLLPNNNTGAWARFVSGGWSNAGTLTLYPGSVIYINGPVGG